MYWRGFVVAGLGVLGACGTGNGDCGYAYESPDALTFAVVGGTYSATCFQSMASQPLLEWAYIESSPPAHGSGIVVGIGLRTVSPCDWGPDVSWPLDSSCVDIQARELINGDSVHPRWTALGGYSAFTAINQGAPRPTGALTVDAWATGPGQPLAVSFSSDAALVYPANFESNGPVAALAPVSGSIMTVTRRFGG